ncbi:hypothetical protein ACFWRZ_09070 [Streptomyces rubiginosohelvolus]
MSSKTPVDRERPVTQREFRAALLLVLGALIAYGVALIFLLALVIKG